jgi:O-antigen ligase
MRLSAPLVPALLLFLLISDYFQGPRHTRLLYLTLSAVGLGLSLEVLWNAWQRGFVVPDGWHSWISDLQSPLLIVPNDTVLLAIIAPLSLALLCCESSKVRKVVPAVSILLSILAVCVIQSRIATLTILVCLTSATALVRPRLTFGSGLAVLTVALLLDAALGFPLSSKFSLLWDPRIGHIWGGRVPLWSAAWTSFVTSPILGHGPQTFDYVSSASIHLRWAHNLYLEMLGERGIIGLITLGLLLFSGISAARTLNGAQLAETRYLGAGAFAALIGFCVASFFELSFLRQWTVIIFFTILAVIAQLAWYKQETEKDI